MKKDEIIRQHLFVPNSWLNNLVINMTKKHLMKQVPDPVLREKLMSKDVFGCKRPMTLDLYFPVFNNENVDLVTDSVVGLTEGGVVSRDETGGEEERKVDVLIWGTGEPSLLVLITSQIDKE